MIVMREVDAGESCLLAEDTSVMRRLILFGNAAHWLPNLEAAIGDSLCTQHGLQKDVVIRFIEDLI